ncbi:MAG TPA: glycosyl hydrolase family 18 protein [Flavitalea sp.]|nr:glycosyl hydrolase family 18 protein [Flavitalea sp.]
MRKNLTLLNLVALCCTLTYAQQKIIPVKSAGDFPVKAMSISVPPSSELDSFVTFINDVMAPRQINTLLLRVDYHYQYKSHPELVDSGALSQADVDKIVAACSKNNIRIIPQINLLGHQSWAGRIGKLLEKYPQFDETPWIPIPEDYKWPNADSLYCKSYCPLHPDVHKVVFALVDEICEAFKTTAYHAGMDEVFYIGMDKCPRCSGKNKAELFANEVNTIRDHLAQKGRTLYIWADRLINGFETGIGGWEASFNYTWPAIELIKKDVVMTDWHYERPDKTPAYFATHGFKVITATWDRPAVAVEQYKDMQKFYAESTPEMSANFLGMMQTVWTSPSHFYTEFYAANDTAKNLRSSGKAFRNAFPKSNIISYKSDKGFPIVAYAVCKTVDQIAGINFNGITHLNFAFANPDTSGNFVYNECLDSLVKVAHKNGVKILASIGGGSAPAYYSKLLQDGNRTKLIGKLTRMAIDYNLDGIDVDLEGERIDENYEKFVTGLATALKPANKLVTAAIATVYKDRLTDKALSQFDYVTIMTYDKTGPWRPEQPGHHSPYSMAVEDLDYWGNTRKLDRKKMFLGLPFYGYSFGPKGASSMSYKDIVSTFPKSEKKDELKMPDGSALYYNGIPTIQKKVKLAKKDAGGIMFWHIGGDATGDKSLVTVINNEAAKP